MRATPFNLDGQRYVIVNHIDITKRKLAERALQKARGELETRVKQRSRELEDVNRALRNEVEERKRAEDMFRSTFNQAAVGIAHIAPDGRFIRLNQMYCDIVGYTHDELIKRTYQSITYPDDLATDLNYNNQLIKGKIDTFSTEKRCIRKDGSIVWVDLTVSIVQGKDRQPEYLIAVIEDIRDRKRTENAIRKSREMLRLVMDNIPQAIFWKDIHSVYLGCNTVFARYAGVGTPENIVGKTNYDLVFDCRRRINRNVTFDNARRPHKTERR